QRFPAFWERSGIGGEHRDLAFSDGDHDSLFLAFNPKRSADCTNGRSVRLNQEWAVGVLRDTEQGTPSFERDATRVFIERDAQACFGIDLNDTAVGQRDF